MSLSGVSSPCAFSLKETATRWVSELVHVNTNIKHDIAELKIPGALAKLRRKRDFSSRNSHEEKVVRSNSIQEYPSTPVMILQ